MDKLVTLDTHRLVLPKHHSLADWDFQPGAFFFLDTWTYISEPKCLAIPSTTTSKNYYGWVMLKSVIDGCIPHGAIVGYFRRGTVLEGTLYLYCRAQALPPSVGQPSHPVDCYYMTTNYNHLYFRKRVGGVQTQLADIILPTGFIFPQIWQLYRFIWGTESTPGGDVCRLSFQLEVSGEWSTAYTFDDSANLWAASAVNLVGFNMGGYGLVQNNRTRADDTGIWKRNV